MHTQKPMTFKMAYVVIVYLWLLFTSPVSMTWNTPYPQHRPSFNHTAHTHDSSVVLIFSWPNDTMECIVTVSTQQQAILHMADKWNDLTKHTVGSAVVKRQMLAVFFSSFFMCSLCIRFLTGLGTRESGTRRTSASSRRRPICMQQRQQWRQPRQ